MSVVTFPSYTATALLVSVAHSLWKGTSEVPL